MKILIFFLFSIHGSYSYWIHGVVKLKGRTRRLLSPMSQLGYIHPHSRPSVANVWLTPRPTRGWLVNRLALLTVPYHSPHRRFRDRGIDLPDEVRCSPYARVATSVMDKPYPVEVVLTYGLFKYSLFPFNYSIIYHGVCKS